MVTEAMGGGPLYCQRRNPERHPRGPSHRAL